MTFALVLGQALIGWLLADLLTGLFHWWEDRVGRVDMPLIGRWIIAPNRLHHTDPLAFAGKSLVERNLSTGIVVVAVSGAWLWITGPTVTRATATLGGLVANEVHRLAHLPQLAGRATRVLQEIGLLQSPRHHAGHHRPPSDRRYCTLTDWLNPALDALGVWTRLEDAMARVGLAPNRGTR